MSQKKTVYSMSTFIGETMIGLPSPVFIDIHYPILINQPPVTLITGQPGSGKTFLGLTLAAHSSALGKLTVILDPKGDFIALKNLEKHGYLKDVKIWSILNSNNEINIQNIGMLDPLNLTEKVDENISTTMDAINSLVKGGLSASQTNLLQPLLRDEVKEAFPSLTNVIRKIKSEKDDEVRSLAYKLETILNLTIASLLLSSTKVKNDPPNLDSGTIVVSLMGLDLPTPDKLESEYSNEERLSVVIMTLLTRMILTVLRKKPKTTFKSLFVDEAWVVFSSPAGRAMLTSVGLLGRSLNMATVLLTQSPTHIQTEKNESKLDTSISTRFVFSSRSMEDNSLNCANLGLPVGIGWEDEIKGLQTGECILKDCRESIAVMRVITDPFWAKAFNTKPEPEKKEKVA